MIEALINKIDSKAEFEDELFFQILETTDTLQKAQTIEKVRQKCKEVDRLDEFNNLLVAWEKKAKELMPEATTKLESFTASELMEMDLPELKTVVEDILKIGVCVLSAKSKMYKSWLCLQMGIAVASGTEFLGKKTTKCDVLYIDLENDKRLSKERLIKLLAGNKAPQNLFLINDTPTMEKGFTKSVEAFLKEHTDIHLVIIDIFARVKYQKRNNQTDYEADYRSITELKRLSEQYDLAIILVTHNRKMTDDTDAFTNIMGSTAIMGASDEAIVIYKARRTDAEATISITGRTVESLDLKATFDKDICKWKLLGEAEEYERQKQKAEYDNSPIVSTIRKLVQQGKGKWKGKLSELISASKYFDKKIYDSAKAVSNKLKDLSYEMQMYDGIFTDTVRNGNAGKIYIFSTSPFDEEETQTTIDEAQTTIDESMLK